MKVRFMHMADVHLGYAQYGSSARYNDFYKTFSRAVDDALREQVDFVIIAGDLFHKRSISPQTLLQAAHELERLKLASIPVVGVMGNHERPHYRDRASWLSYLAGRGLMILLGIQQDGETKKLVFAPYQNGSGCYIDLGELRLYGIGYCGASMHRVLDEFRTFLDGDGAPDAPAFTILVAHDGLDGIIPRFVANLRREQLAGLRPHVDYLALGHIHKPYQEEGWIFNPGSLEPNSMSEANFHGGAYFVEVNAAGGQVVQVEHRQYTERPFIQLAHPVTQYESPDALYAGVEKDIAGQRAAHEKRPVVEYTLEGTLHFGRQSLDLARVESLVKEALHPIVTRVRNLAAPAEYEVGGGDGQLSRSELELQMLSDLIARDGRYRKQSGEWAGVVRTLKQLALERNSPEIIAGHLRAGMERIAAGEEADADHED